MAIRGSASPDQGRDKYMRTCVRHDSEGAVMRYRDGMARLGGLGRWPRNRGHALSYRAEPRHNVTRERTVTSRLGRKCDVTKEIGNILARRWFERRNECHID